MNDWRLKEPKIALEGNYVKVTIAHIPLATPEDTIIEFLNHHPLIKNQQARELTGTKSENKMKSIFLKLLKENFIEPVMSKNGTTKIAWKKKGS